MLGPSSFWPLFYSTPAPPSLGLASTVASAACRVPSQPFPDFLLSSTTPATFPVYGACYGLDLDVPQEPHVLRGESFIR